MMVYRLTCTGLEIPTPLPNAYDSPPSTLGSTPRSTEVANSSRWLPAHLLPRGASPVAASPSAACSCCQAGPARPAVSPADQPGAAGDRQILNAELGLPVELDQTPPRPAQRATEAIPVSRGTAESASAQADPQMLLCHQDTQPSHPPSSRHSTAGVHRLLTRNDQSGRSTVGCMQGSASRRTI
jgi:hypothetical protein